MEHEHGRAGFSGAKPGSDAKEGNRARAAWRVLLGALAALFVFVLYLRTLSPTVLYYSEPNLLDAVMVQMQVAVLGITHPTGYPTYLTLTHLFTYLPFGDVAYRANLASAVYAVGALCTVYAGGLLLGGRAVAAAVGALAFGLGGALWSQAVITEVYTLNALFLGITVLALLVWRRTGRDRWLLVSAVLVGLCLTNHLTSGLMLPAAFLFVFLVDRRKFLDVGLMLKSAGLFFLGLTPYLYLPIRSWMDAPFLGNKPDTLDRFLYLVTGGNLRGTFFAFGPAEFPGRVMFYLEHLLYNIHWSVVMVAFSGAAVLFLKDRATAALLAFLFFGWTFYAIENDIPDINLYFIPTYLVLCLWAAVGFGAILELLEDLLSRLPGVPGPGKAVALGAVSVAMLLLPLPGVGDKYETNDMSDAYRGREIIEAVAEKTARGATVLHHRSELWYMVLVEERRQDLTLVDPFWHNPDISYADIVWPEDAPLATLDKRYGTDDFTGVTAAAKAAEKGPVYITDQGVANPKTLRGVGFRIVEVEPGVLYELVPPGRKPQPPPE